MSVESDSTRRGTRSWPLIPRRGTAPGARRTRDSIQRADACRAQHYGIRLLRNGISPLLERLGGNGLCRRLMELCRPLTHEHPFDARCPLGNIEQLPCDRAVVLAVLLGERPDLLADPSESGANERCKRNDNG